MRMDSRPRWLGIVALLLAILGSAANAQTRKVESFSLADTQGKPHSAGEWKNAKGVVLFILGTECPVANGYAPLMQRLAATYEPRGVVCYGVHPDADVTADVAAVHAKEYGLKFPILLDGQQKLVSQTGARVLGQAVLLSPQGEVLYQGRIDDKYSETGRRRDEARVKDLEQAIDAVLAGKRPPVAETKAFGCPIPKVRR